MVFAVPVVTAPYKKAGKPAVPAVLNSRRFVPGAAKPLSWGITANFVTHALPLSVTTGNAGPSSLLSWKSAANVASRCIKKIGKVKTQIIRFNK
jgi:hypothetical protein